jgi:hypothetical protein
MKIAQRVLILRESDRDTEIPITIFSPVQDKPGAWYCRYDVGWPEGLRSSEAWGVDGIQALLIALGKIGAELYTSNYHKSGRLQWREQGEGYGFLVAPSLRDLLVGDDAKYL